RHLLDVDDLGGVDLGGEELHEVLRGLAVVLIERPVRALAVAGVEQNGEHQPSPPGVRGVQSTPTSAAASASGSCSSTNSPSTGSSSSAGAGGSGAGPGPGVSSRCFTTSAARTRGCSGSGRCSSSAGSPVTLNARRSACASAALRAISCAYSRFEPFTG